MENRNYEVELVDQKVREMQLYSPECHFIGGVFYNDEQLNELGEFKGDKEYLQSAQDVFGDCRKIFTIRNQMGNQICAYEKGEVNLEKLPIIAPLIVDFQFDLHDLQWSYTEYSMVFDIAKENLQKLYEVIVEVRQDESIPETDDTLHMWEMKADIFTGGELSSSNQTARFLAKTR